MRVWPVIENALSRQFNCVMISVIETRGSVPRETGARLVVLPDEFHGTIGGGQLEWQALAMARKMLDDGIMAVSFHEFALGPELGQCCGGAVKLMFEGFSQGDEKQVKILADAQKTTPLHTAGTIGERIERVIVGRKSGTASAVHISDERIEERFGCPQRPLYLFGAGHIGRALARLLANMPFDVIWVDERTDMLPQIIPENIRPVFTADPLGVLDKAPCGSFVLILTHSHDLDFSLVRKALGREEFGFVGVIGSRTKKQRFIKRLQQAGLQKAQIKQLVCPIGIPGILRKTPDVIALSVAAQLLIEDEKQQ